MPEFIHSKARLGQAPGIVVSPRSGKGNHPRKVVESQQGNGAVAGHEEVVSSSTTYAAINGDQVLVSLNLKIEGILICHWA